LNGIKTTIPSAVVKEGDIIAVREGSKKTKTFADVVERNKSYTVQDWLSFDTDKMTGKVLKMPTLTGQDVLFDLGQVIEFSKR
jgi:small subunit ribosomal protein S4